MQSDTSLSAEGIRYAYGQADVLQDVTLQVRAGESVALGGPNGSGKTTLLKILSGVRRPGRGTVTVGGRDLSSLSPAQIARRIAVVPQSIDPRLSFRVETVVAMGRTPYTRTWGGPARADIAAIERAMEATAILPLRGRPFNELSGGEQQRVMLATALAQEGSYLLLDEPTVHLDLHHQHEILELVAALQEELGMGVLAVMHDLNLAALYFDRLALLDGGRIRADGAPAEVLYGAELRDIFRAPLEIVPHPRDGVPQVLLSRRRNVGTPSQGW